MAGDINLHEQILILPPDSGTTGRSLTRSLAQTGGRIMHEYGPRVQIVELPRGREDTLSRAMPGVLAPAAKAVKIPADLDETGRFGLQAMQLRESKAFLKAKANRPYNNQSWREGGTETLRCTDHTLNRREAQALAKAPATSARLHGSVAVGLIIVEGPTEELRFTPDERAKVVAEVQNGLGWLGSQNPSGTVVWKYDIKLVQLDVPPGPNDLSFNDKEALWRDPVMKKMGYGIGMGAVLKYVEAIRTQLNTDWTFCAFFTKYPVGHFAYAGVGGPRLVMHYQNDGWGPDNIDRVFAHETGHIFGAPDEYEGSGCSCDSQWGFHQWPNTNCESCNPHSADCIMKGNTWNMCEHTTYHLGFPMSEQRFSGVWRSGADKHGLWVNSTWTSFINKWKEWGSQGLRLIDFTITTESEGRRYHGVWREGTDAYGLWVNADWENFKSKWQEWGRKGLRLTHLEIIPGDQPLYSGIWASGNDAYGLWVNADWESFKSKWQEWGRKGLRLIDIKVVQSNNELRYYGVWREGSGKYGLWVNADWESFSQKWRDWALEGLRLIDLEIMAIGGERRYFGVWGPGKDAYGLWVNADWNNFKTKWEDWAGKGYRLIDIDVHYPDNSPRNGNQRTRSMKASAVEKDAKGIGFLSSEHIVLTTETDLETGEAVFPAIEETNRKAAAQPRVSGPGSELPVTVLSPEEGLGGMAASLEAPAASPNGFGGIGEGTASADDDGMGGVVFYVDNP